jgi:hypothetical protein
VEDGPTAIAGDRQAGLHLLEVGPAVLGMPEPGRDEPLLDLLVGAIQRDRGHVPVQPGDVQAEGGDRLRPDRADDGLQRGRDRVQGAANAVVVQRRRRDPQDLGDRPGPRPVFHSSQRRWRGQPVGHQRLDHLPVGQGGHLPDRAGPVDNPAQVKAPAEVGHHRQGP